MATLREFILNQSTLPTGNTVRDHIQNPGSGGGGGTVIMSGAVTVDVEEITTEVVVTSVAQVSAVLVDQATITPEKTVAVEVNGVTTDVGVCK